MLLLKIFVDIPVEISNRNWLRIEKATYSGWGSGEICSPFFTDTSQAVSKRFWRRFVLDMDLHAKGI